MTAPLVILAACTVLLSLVCTPFWPALEHYLSGPSKDGHEITAGLWALLALSTLASFTGVGLAAWAYQSVRTSNTSTDPWARRYPSVAAVLHQAFGVDALYAATVRRIGWGLAQAAAWLDRWLWVGLVDLVQTLGQVSGWLSRKVDEEALNGGFDAGCASTQATGNWLSRLQNGRAPRYLRFVAVGMMLLTLWLILGRKAG